MTAMTILTRSRRRTAPPVPVLVYRNASASIGVFETGNCWTLSVGKVGVEATFQFSNRDAAEKAAGWLSYKDLTGLVRPGMSWHALVDAVNDVRPVAGATEPAIGIQSARVERSRPAWMEQRRAQYETRTDTPSSRVQAQRQADRDHHQAVWDSGYQQANTDWLRKPFAERLTEADGEAIAELWVRTLISGGPELREQAFQVLVELDGRLEGSVIPAGPCDDAS